MKRKKQFYSWFGDDDTHSYHTPIYNHSEALKQVSSGVVLLGQLQQQRGKMVTVVTPEERLTGIVEQIFSDHILLRVIERAYYIPMSSVLYFYV